MAEILEVGITAGVPTSGTGEVPTLAPVRDELIDANLKLDDIVTSVQTIDNAISGTEMQVDVLTLIPGTGATNLGKAKGSAAGATDTGITTLAVRDDALAEHTDPEGDYVPLRVDANGQLWINTSAIEGILNASIAKTADIDEVTAAVNSFAITDTVSVKVQTAATGTNWTNFASQACKYVVLTNMTGTDLVWRREGETDYSDLPGSNGVIGTIRIEGITNINDIEVKRADDSNTQVTLRGFVAV